MVTTHTLLQNRTTSKQTRQWKLSQSKPLIIISLDICQTGVISFTHILRLYTTTV